MLVIFLPLKRTKLSKDVRVNKILRNCNSRIWLIFGASQFLQSWDKLKNKQKQTGITSNIFNILNQNLIKEQTKDSKTSTA